MRFIKKILFYSDAIALGGHEIMSLAASTSIREYYPATDIQWLVSEDNKRLLQKLQQGGFCYSFLKATPRGRLLQHPFAVLRAVMANSRKIRKLAPDVVVVAQGIVTFSLLGSLAARLAGVSHCCYQPTGGLASDRDPKHGSRLLDTLWTLCYRHTHKFITIDEEQKRLIAASNPAATIRIVENYIPKVMDFPYSGEQLRRTWQIGDRRVIGVVGRISFPDKRQDWLLREIAADPFWKDYLILFIGDGPDSTQLAQLVTELDLGEQVRIMGWSESVHTLYPALDALLIPSRCEGVPLVMLESLAQKVPVIGSNRDGMKVWLPAEWRFEAGDAEGMKQAVLAALQRGETDEFWRDTQEHLNKIHDRKRFATEFFNAISSFV
ncbi:MAG TPA: glycosyltransferase [Candidatus Binataceae bacterium]|nr:glycosyltransferase [Candidatus Binataceae bacterium]